MTCLAYSRYVGRHVAPFRLESSPSILFVPIVIYDDSGSLVRGKKHPIVALLDRSGRSIRIAQPHPPPLLPSSLHEACAILHFDSSTSIESPFKNS